MAEKIGAGALQAFLRQGLKEVAQVLPATRESVQVVEEPGAMGVNLPPQLVAQQMQAKDAKEPEMDR